MEGYEVWGAIYQMAYDVIRYQADMFRIQDNAYESFMWCDVILLQASLFSDHIIILKWQVHIKWSNRITKLLVQCLESSEYIEIRNALTVLTKISSVFPVIRKTGINLERRVSAFSDIDSVVRSVASPVTNQKGFITG